MKMKHAAFTLTEVVVSLAIVGISAAGIMSGYVSVADKVLWSNYSLSAQSLALQGTEQVRSAQWDPHAWPPVDELGLTNLIQAEQLDVPGGQPLLATNYITVTSVSTNPPVRQLRTDCVWFMPGRGAKKYGPFTNTVITLRTADQ
jgi:prepilin-type N-terminal cleavage/methylation domain-containing protein